MNCEPTHWYVGEQSAVRIIQRHGILVTFECYYPMIIHPEIMTHRMFSRNAQSNRAMSLSKLREEVEFFPYFPVQYLKEQKGMVGTEPISKDDVQLIEYVWGSGMTYNYITHENLEKYGLHKQWTNRILWPYQHIRVLITATDWSNFFELRLSEDAQPEIQELALLMDKAMVDTADTIIGINETWHLPYITTEDYAKTPQYKDLCMISAARCARVSYGNPGELSYEKDFKLSKRLLKNRHMSPFEHQARKIWGGTLATQGVTHVTKWGDWYSGNFRMPWIQFRQEVEQEEHKNYD